MIPDYEKRVFARVLSTKEVAQACEELGFRGRNLICMQGPFSEELNTAMLRQFDCRYLVTKETGKAGGFKEKLRAAEKAGAKVVLVGRPEEQSGYSYGEIIEILKEKFPELKKSEKIVRKSSEHQTEPKSRLRERVVTLIGIGMGTLSGMTAEALEALEEADLLIGAGRMLQAAEHVCKPVYKEYDPVRIADYINAHPEIL